MEHFEITKTSEGFHIEGFPDAVKVIRLDGPKAQRLADLALHKADLEFALDCLEQINKVPEQPYVLRQALWRSAVVHYKNALVTMNRDLVSFHKRCIEAMLGLWSHTSISTV